MSELPPFIAENGIEILLAFLLLVLIIQSLLAEGKIARSLAMLKKAVKERLDDAEMNMREKLTKEIRERTPTTDSIRHSVREELNENLIFIREVAQKIEPEQRAAMERFEEIKKLFTQQGVYLHDCFAHLESGEEKRMEKALEELAQRMQRLREELLEQLSTRAREEQALLQNTVQNATQLMSEAVNRLTGEVNAKLSLLGENLNKQFTAGLSDTVESFQSLQQRVNELIETKAQMENTGREVASLSRLMLSQRHGETQARLSELLATALPEDAYQLNAVVGGKTAAAALKLPSEEGVIAVDSDLSVEELDDILNDTAADEERAAARARWGDYLTARVNAVADGFITPPKTANAALLFVASETAYAEIQAHHRGVLELATSRRVWLVSPTALLAVLNMARGVIKDYQARQQLEKMQAALHGVVEEAQAFESRLSEIGDHVGNAMRSVKRAESAGLRLLGNARDAAGNHSSLPSK